MFESLLQGNQQKSAVDVLDTLLDPKNITMKTDLNMTQIKILCQLKWYSLLKDPSYKDKSPTELLDLVMTYFLELMVSLKRKSREESIKGIAEMKDKLLDQQLLLAMPKR